MTMPRKIAVLFPRSQSRGGALSVAAHMLDILQDHCELTVVTLDQCEPAKWNETYGTHIRTGEIQWKSFGSRFPLAGALLGKIGMFTLDQFVLMAWERRILDPDVVPLSAHNEMAFGRRGMQYIHFPMLMVGSRELAKLVGQPGTLLKDLLGYACRLVFRVRNGDLVHNDTVCNSRWTCDVFSRYYGSELSPGCLYPPCTASGIPLHAAWAKREHGVVMIGRLVAHKRLEDGLKIVQGVRARGHNLHVHLVSSGGDEHYIRHLRDAFRDMDWIHWETGLSRDGLLKLVQSHRYGLHCNHNEHFGMVTAEMSGSGCLVLGHDSGGTCEILPLPGQRYDTVEAGIDRLEQMHTNVELQIQMLDFNRKHSAAFGPEQFRESLLAWVSAFDPD